MKLKNEKLYLLKNGDSIPIDNFFGPIPDYFIEPNRDLFISHAWGEKVGEIFPDLEKVKELVQKLESNNIKCWLDNREMKDDMDDSVFNGIDASHLFLCCITPTYFEKIVFTNIMIIVEKNFCMRKVKIIG